MSPETHPEDFRRLVGVLLAIRGWTQEKLAAEARVCPSTIANYMAGKLNRPTRAQIERIAGAAGVELFVVDLFLLPGLTAHRQAGHRAQDDVIPASVQQLGLELLGLGHLPLPAALQTGDRDRPRSWPPAEVAQEEALDLWKRLEDCQEDRWRLVETWPEYQHPGLAVLLCHESAEAASDRADRALELAKLAHRVAELTLGGDAEKRRLVGYAGAFLANALRVSGELRPARARFEDARASWNADQGSPTFLPEWRVLVLEASLLRDERQFDLALARLDEALALAPGEAGRILLKSSSVHEQMGEGERAVEDLRQAKGAVDREREPRLFFGVRFNLATSLCLLDRSEEAEGMYPEIQELAAARELDNVRVQWLAGRIAAGRGRLDEADAALDQVRQEFTQRKSPWDTSLVTLELATVCLRQGRTADVRTLAEELLWVFKAQGIHREALAALALFRQAAEREIATADFTERLARYLRKAQGDPGLRFSDHRS